MEHVSDPGSALREVSRTLLLGGRYIFTAPTYKRKVEGERRAFRHPDGRVEVFAPGEYEGDPTRSEGSLVYFHYGYEFAREICESGNFSVVVLRFVDAPRGIVGAFTVLSILTAG